MATRPALAKMLPAPLPCCAPPVGLAEPEEECEEEAEEAGLLAPPADEGPAEGEAAGAELPAGAGVGVAPPMGAVDAPSI